jgi:thioredoxin domain-containing protein 10
VPYFQYHNIGPRLYRAYYEARSSIVDMWRGNPALTAVLFGLPIGFLSLICYSICCADIMDAEEDEDDDETGGKMFLFGGQCPRSNLRHSM